MDPVSLLERTIARNRDLIAGLDANDFARPTPCWGWTVRDLINHMVGVNRFFTAALAGEAPPLGGPPPDLVGDDPAGAYRAATEASLAAWRAPAALTKTIQFGANPIPAAAAIRLNQGDEVLHHWDLTKALGRPPTLDADLIAQADATLRSFLQPEFRGPGRGFGYAVDCPADASPLDRLVAFSGRQP